MDKNRRSFWLSLCLINLCIVALLGFTLRSKILFSIPFVDFRNVESAHSHFAFSGWVGLALTVLFIYDLLPPALSQRKIYQWILSAIELSSIGMALLFPFYGYNAATIFFSSLYIVAMLVFVPVFIRDILRTSASRPVKLLTVSSLASLVLSFSGTAGLIYIIVAHKGGSLLYRDSIYTFLHFQYNGFFTLAIFSLFLHQLFISNGPTRKAWLFSVFLAASVVPGLFLSLLWHNRDLFYLLGALGCLCILVSLVFFAGVFQKARGLRLFRSPFAKGLWMLSCLSFFLKMILQVGTILPQLGNAVYGDRPLIIGFLHLVFLGFVSFYILSVLIESGYFTNRGKLLRLPFWIFGSGIILNELLLMLQGLGILFKTNNDIYKRMLWGASIVLLSGAIVIALARLIVVRAQKKP
jgi:hypothetical protein